MTRALYNDALTRLLVNEGGYVNHPRDPGGPTNKGVTQKVYDGYRRLKKQRTRSVKSITIEEVREIYRRQYADVVHFDELPAGVDYVVFDGAVNSGPGRAGKWLQQALGPLYVGRIDGQVASSTLDAVRQHPDHDALIAEILRLRLIFLKHLSTWSAFGKGWANRVNDVRHGGQAWASGSVPDKNEYHEGGEAKAFASDMKVPNAPVGAPVVGSAGGGVSVAAETARGALQPIVDSGNAPPIILYILVGLTVLGVVIAAAGFGYGLWAKHRTKKLRAILDPDDSGAAVGS